MYDSNDSVTRWFHELGQGDSKAAFELWRCYFDRLVDLVRRDLPRSAGVNRDEQDLALSAFAALCDGVQEGRFAQVRNRDELWKLLVVIARHKRIDYQKRELRKKRGGGRNVSFVELLDSEDANDEEIACICSRMPTPAEAAEIAEMCEFLIESLSDDRLQQIARLRLQGFSNSEVATQLGLVPRTIRRKVEIIRTQWSEVASR